MPALNHTITDILPGGKMRLDRYIAESLGICSPVRKLKRGN